MTRRTTYRPRTLELRLAGPSGPRGSRGFPRRVVEIARCSPAACLAKEGEVFAGESDRAQQGSLRDVLPQHDIAK